MAAIVRIVTDDLTVTDDTRFLGVEVGSERGPREHVAKLPPIVTTVRLPPVRVK